MVGKTFGSLVVIKYDAEAETAKVRCECGTIEYRLRSVLERGRSRMCRDCAARVNYRATVKTDLERVRTLQPEIATRVLAAFARHLEMCQAYKTAPARLATFIHEAMADPTFGEELDQSFEARLQRSNPQSYRQYQRPKKIA